MIGRFLGDAFGVLSFQFWSTVLQSGARLPIHTLNYWTEQSVVLGYSLGVSLSMILLIVDPCFIRSGVTRCTLLMVLYLDHMCQCGYTLCLVAHRYTYCSDSLQNLAVEKTFIPMSVSLWNDLPDPVFDGVGLATFKSRANAFLLA